jgi:hypothetical protein
MMLPLMDWCIISVVHQTNRPSVPSPSQAQAAPYLGSLARLEMETARRSPEAESLRRTLPSPTWRHGVASPSENYIITPCGTRKARMRCDGSKRAAPDLRFAQTHASCIEQLCMHLLFALSAAMGFVVLGVDCTNTYANFLSPSQPTYVRIDDAYVD